MLCCAQCAAGGCHHWRVVDGANVDVYRAQIDVGAAAGSGVAVVVDVHLDRIGVVAVGMRRAVQVGQVAGGIKIVVQICQAAFQGQRCTGAANGDAGAGCGTDIATGAGGQCDRQAGAVGINVRQSDR